MRCQVCGKGNQREGAECSYCGATIRSVLGQGMPLPPEIDRELSITLSGRRERASRRRRKRLVWHTVSGAIILFAVAVLAHVAFFLLRPKEMLLGILRSIPVALVFGPPIGFIVSWRNFGVLGGAIVGSLMFALGISIAGGGASLGALLLGAIPGIFVGGLMGFHVTADND